MQACELKVGDTVYLDGVGSPPLEVVDIVTEPTFCCRWLEDGEYQYADFIAGVLTKEDQRPGLAQRRLARRGGSVSCGTGRLSCTSSTVPLHPAAQVSRES